MTAQPKHAKAETGADVPDSKDPIKRTVDNVNGQNIMGDFRRSDLLDAAGALTGWALTHAVELAKASLVFWGELGKIAAGQSRHSVDRGDRSFSDPAGASVKLGCEAGTLHLSRIFDTIVKSPIDQALSGVAFPLRRSRSGRHFAQKT